MDAQVGISFCRECRNNALAEHREFPMDLCSHNTGEHGSDSEGPEHATAIYQVGVVIRSTAGTLKTPKRC